MSSQEHEFEELYKALQLANSFPGYDNGDGYGMPDHEYPEIALDDPIWDEFFDFDPKPDVSGIEDFVNASDSTVPNHASLQAEETPSGLTTQEPSLHNDMAQKNNQVNAGIPMTTPSRLSLDSTVTAASPLGLAIQETNLDDSMAQKNNQVNTGNVIATSSPSLTLNTALSPSSQGFPLTSSASVNKGEGLTANSPGASVTKPSYRPSAGCATKALYQNRTVQMASPTTPSENYEILHFVEGLPLPGPELPKMAQLMNPLAFGLDTKTIFQSIAEARAYREFREEVHHDPTLPTTDLQRCAIVKALVRAFNNMDGINNDGNDMKNMFANKKYSDSVIEAACWKILHACEKRHTYGPLLPNYGIKTTTRGRIPTFAQRMTHIIYYLTYSKTGCKQMVAAPGIKNIVDDPCEFVKRIKTNKRLNDKKGQTLQRNKEAQNSQNPEAKATEPKGKGEKKAEKPTASAMELPHAAQDSPGPMGVQTPQILRQTEAIPATTQSRQKPDPIGVRMPVHPSLNGPMSATPTAQQPGLVGIRTPVHSGMNVALTITPESRQNSGVNAVRMPAHSSLNGAISTTPSPQQPGLVAVRTPVNPRPNGIMSTAPSPQQPGLVAVRAPVNPRPNGVMSTTPSPRQPGLMAVQKPMHPSLNGVVSTAPSPQPGLVGVRTPVNSRPNGAISTTPSPQKTNLMGFQTPMHPSPNGAMYTAPSPQKPGIRVVRTPQNPRQNGAIAARQQSPPKPDDLSGFISPEAMQGFITGLSAYDPTPVLREAPVVTASQGAFDGNPATVSRNQMRAATPMMAPASQPMNMPAVMGNVYPYGMQMTPSPAMYHPMFQQNMAMAGFYPSPAVQNPYATPMHSRSTSGASQPSMLGSPYPTPQSFHRGMAASGMENRIPTNMIAAPVPNGPQKRSISQVYGQQYDNLPANKRQC